MKNFFQRTLCVILSTAVIAGMLCAGADAARAEDSTSAPEAYIRQFSAAQPERGEALYAAAQKLGTSLDGRSILFFGDSLTAGYGLSDYSQSWCSLLESCYGMQVDCHSVSGSTFGTAENQSYSPGGCFSPICQRELPEGDYDIIFVEGGGNDWYCEIPMGSSNSSRDTRNFRGALNVTIDRIQAKYPQALLLFSTSWEGSDTENSLGYDKNDYNQAIIDVCAYRGVLCYRACDPGISGVYMTDPAFQRMYSISEGDYWHLNAKGHLYYLPKIAKWLMAMTEQNYLVRGFYDVEPGDWFASHVDGICEKGLMVGMTETAFGPNEDMTRGMLMAVLYRAAGAPDASELEMPFEDVDSSMYYFNPIRWGIANRIIYGMDETHFAPDSPLERQQMVSILYRICGAPAADTDVLGGFRDSGEIKEYAVPAMAWAIQNGLIYGMGDQLLEPAGTATRAQVAAIVLRYLNQYSI